MSKTRFAALAVVPLLLGFAMPAQAQPNRPDLEGMWSDPPLTIADSFCFAFCTEAGLDYLDALLDDPANDERAFAELRAEASDHQREEYIRPRLTAAAAAAFPLDPADDLGFLECVPWGFARQIFAPHQIQIRQYDNRVEMRYGEWDARRTIVLDGREPPENEPTSPLGFSVGRYEGNTLVIETSGIDANITFWRSEHSDQLRAVERYTRPENGDRLELSVTLEDSWSLRERLVVKKVWGWAPDEEIFPYEDCERPTEFTRRE